MTVKGVSGAPGQSLGKDGPVPESVRVPAAPSRPKPIGHCSVGDPVPGTLTRVSRYAGGRNKSNAVAAR